MRGRGGKRGGEEGERGKERGSISPFQLDGMIVLSRPFNNIPDYEKRKQVSELKWLDISP